MAPQIKLTVTGAAALKLTLDDIVGKVARRAARKSLEEASKVVLEAAQANLVANESVETKSLFKSLGRRVVALKSGGGYVAIIGPRYDTRKKIAAGQRRFGKWKRRKGSRKPRFMNPVKYARLVEFGTRPHRTFKGSTSRGTKGEQQAKFEAGGLFEHFSMHPGAKPKPFMRPAYDSTRRQVMAIQKRRFGELFRGAVVVAK